MLDGRNRLDALQLLGREIFVSKYDSSAINGIQKRMTHKKRQELAAADPDRSSLSRDVFVRADVEDPFAYVVSKNIHRRHLTADVRREIIGKIITAKPEASNRQIAKDVGVDHKTVAKVRTELEATGEIPQLEKTTGADGKARPARRERSTLPAVEELIAIAAEADPEPEQVEVTEFADGPSGSAEVIDIGQRRAENADLEEQRAAEASAVLFAEFARACRTLLPQMTEADRQKARALVNDLTSGKLRAWLRGMRSRD